MTERLFLTDSHMTRCEATVLSVAQTKAGFDILLDRSVFFPNAGGQPADRGTLQCGDTVVRVLGADECAGEIVLHTDTALPVGSAVSCTLDWARRFDMMQQHTGEHILSYSLYTLFGAVNVGFHLAEDYGTIDMDRPLSHEQVTEAERYANALLFDDRPVTAKLYDSEEDIKDLPLRKHAEGLTAPIRIVTVEGADCCTCCAPHCCRTGEVGFALFTDHVAYKGGTRLTFLCGGRALKHARATHDTVDTLARRFSTARDNAASAVQKQAEELGEAHRREKELTERLTGLMAKDLRAGATACGQYSVICARTDGLGPNGVRRLGQSVADDKTVSLIVDVSADRVSYLVNTGNAVTVDAGELIQAVNPLLGGKGGGRGHTAQGSAPVRPGMEEAEEQLKRYLVTRMSAER